MDTEVNVSCWHQTKQLRNKRHLAVKAAATLLTMWHVYNARGRNSGNSTSRTAMDPEQETGMPKYGEPSTIIHMQFFYSVPSVSSHFSDEKHTMIRQATILVGLRRVYIFSLSSLKLPLYKLRKWECIASPPITPKNWQTFKCHLLLQELNTEFLGITQGRPRNASPPPASKLITISFLFTVRDCLYNNLGATMLVWKPSSIPRNSECIVRWTINFSGEIIPTRCNNCVYSSQWLYSTQHSAFRETARHNKTVLPTTQHDRQR